MGKSQGRELASRISEILVHLLRLAASPATDPWPGWRESIQVQRDAIGRLLDDLPSLRQTIPAVIQGELPKARKRAMISLADFGETPRVDVGGPACTEDEVMGDWLPG